MNRMMRSGDQQLPGGMQLAGLETLQISSELVYQLLAILNKSEEEEERERGDGDEDEDEEGDEDDGEEEGDDEDEEGAYPDPPTPAPVTKSATKPPVAVSVSTKPPPAPQLQVQPQSRQDRALLQSFSPLGFRQDEIMAVAKLCRSTVDDEDEFLSALIAHVSGEGRIKPGSLASSALIALHEAAAENADLCEENESLLAIYGPSLSSRRLSLLGTVCSVLDLELDLQQARHGGGASPSLRVVIFSSHLYPHGACNVVCWVTFAAVPAAQLRDVALAASRHVNGCLQERHACCLFDLIQFVQSALIERGGADAAGQPKLTPAPTPAPSAGKAAAPVPTPAPAPPQQQKQQQQQQQQQGGGGRGKGKGKGPPGGVSPSPSAEQLPPPRPTYGKPLTKHTEGSEYRVAFNRALTEGLSGQAARARAYAYLEPVLPESVLAELRAEEALLEILRNRQVNLVECSARCEIDALKLLLAQTDAPKTRGRALLADAKREMVEGDRHHSRDEKALAAAWVAEAAAMYRSQVGSKESKAQAGGNRSPRATDAPEEREAPGGKEKGTEEKEEDAGPSVGSINTQNVENVRLKARQRELSASDLSGASEQQRVQRLELESRRLKSGLESKRQDPKYCELLAVRENLPTMAMRSEIVEVIRRNRVVVLSGDTGCGKTTQVPQLVLDDAIDSGAGGGCNIIVTQPRRISAISVAERIAQERCEKIGESAGYHIRLEVKKSARTRILMMTTGVLLRKLQIEGELVGVSHVFVDEVHERDINTDFLLIVLKQLLARR